MKILCSTVEEFIENLSFGVVGDCVFTSKYLKSLTREPVRTSTSVQVFGHFSAIVKFSEGEAFLEFPSEYGVDRKVSPITSAGSEAYELDKLRIKSFCDALDIRLRPGILDVE